MYVVQRKVEKESKEYLTPSVYFKSIQDHYESLAL